ETVPVERHLARLTAGFEDGDLLDHRATPSLVATLYDVRWLRIAYKVPAVIVLTGFFALIPPVVRLLVPRRTSAERAAAAACRLWGRAMCAVLAVRRDVEGQVPTGAPFLVASNHLSYLDILVLGSLYPSLFLAKREIAGWPLFG